MESCTKQTRNCQKECAKIENPERARAKVQLSKKWMTEKQKRTRPEAGRSARNRCRRKTKMKARHRVGKGTEERVQSDGKKVVGRGLSTLRQWSDAAKKFL